MRSWGIELRSREGDRRVAEGADQLKEKQLMEQKE
jgi:hypothetical protein